MVPEKQPKTGLLRGATSTKVWAGTVSGLLATYIVGLLLDKFGVTVDVDIVAVVIGPPILAAAVFFAGRFAKLGEKYLTDSGLVDVEIVGPASDALLAEAGHDPGTLPGVEPDGPTPEDEPEPPPRRG